MILLSSMSVSCVKKTWNQDLPEPELQSTHQWDPIRKKYHIFVTTMHDELMREGGDPYAVAEFYR